MSIGPVGSSAPISIAPSSGTAAGAAAAPLQGVEGASDEAAAVIGALLSGIGGNLDIEA